MQPRHVARVDAAFKSLQPIAFLQPLRDEALFPRYQCHLELGQRRLLLWVAHVGPEALPALARRIGLQLDALAVAALGRLRGDFDALAGDVVFPAVIRAAQAVLLVAAEAKRTPPMRAEFVDQPVASLRIAKCK